MELLRRRDRRIRAGDEACEEARAGRSAAARLCSRQLARVALGLVCWFVGSGTALSAMAAETVVTAAFGTVRADGSELAVGRSVDVPASGAIEVETGLSSGCALVHGEALLIEMGPSTKLSLRPGDGAEGPLVKVEDGHVRFTTRLDASDAATEIRTPSAIVRPRSSTIHVEVNTGEGTTLVTSLDDRAFVLSNDARHKRGVFLNTSQWVSVPVGGAPGSIEKIDDSTIEGLGGVASQRRYRVSALNDISRDESTTLLADIVERDIPDGEPTSLAHPLPTPKAFEFKTETIDRTLVCDPTTCGLFSVPDFDPGPSDPPGCIGIPGEQCQR